MTSDSLKIHRLLADYADSIDRKNWIKYRDLFTQDAFIDYTAAGGKKGNVDEVAKWMEKVFNIMDSQHLISNIQVNFLSTQEKATVRAAFNNPCTVKYLPFLQPFFTTVGWYIVDVKRTMHDQEPGRGTWRIEHLQEEILFNSVQVAVPVILTIIIGVVYTICRWWCMESGSDLRMHRD